MAFVVPERLTWAMQTMAVAPSDHVLEIGCGRGVAAWLVCQQLTRGRLVAVDRSPTMAEAAAFRNTDSVAAGRAIFLASPLDSADLRDDRFDKVFAVNVNLFWVNSAVGDANLVRRRLKPKGALYLFHERPPARAAAMAQRDANFLTAQGFETSTLRTTTRQGSAVVCVVARPASRRR
jgi:SAM-dependent methyltransferase